MLAGSSLSVAKLTLARQMLAEYKQAEALLKQEIKCQASLKNPEANGFRR